MLRRVRLALRLLPPVLVVSSILCPVSPLLAATIELADPTEAQMRTAIADASDNDEIVISVTAPLTIVLTSGSLEIARDLTITGPGADALTLDGNDSSEVIVCNADTNVTITGLTITGGDAPILGGGVSSSGSLTMNDCVLCHNNADLAGGGVSCSGELTMNGCLLSDNDAAWWGGGVYRDELDEGASLVNCTFCGNYSGIDGGAIFAGQVVTMTNCTITGNTAEESGGGCFIDENALLIPNNNIVAQNSATTGPDCCGQVMSWGCNIFGSSFAAHGYVGDPPPDLFDTDPLLGPLQYNGGATMTRMPLSGSPAIDGVAPGYGTTIDDDPVLTDQRGYARPMDGDADGVPLSDIGACEFHPMVGMAFLDLEQGWNMVSVPLLPDDPDPAEVFAGMEAVYTWDPITKSYTIPEAIEPWCGYWVAMSAATTAKVSGTQVTHWTQPDICRGWNMVGSVYGGSCVFTDPDDDPAGSVEGFGYCWDPETKSYTYCTSIDPWKGYWAASTADCTLTLGPP